MQALKYLVIVLGIIIIAATAFLIYEIVRRATTSDEVAAVSPSVAALADLSTRSVIEGGGASLPVFGEKPLEIPEGARIAAMTVGDGRLVVQVRAQEGQDTLVVVDLATGAVLGRLEIVEKR